MCLGVTVDRSHSGSSLASGQLELLLTRRTVLDDQRGVAENLNETICGCRDCNCPGMIDRGHHILTIENCILHDDRYMERWMDLNRDPVAFYVTGEYSKAIKENRGKGCLKFAIYQMLSVTVKRFKSFRKLTIKIICSE